MVDCPLPETHSIPVSVDDMAMHLRNWHDIVFDSSDWAAAVTHWKRRQYAAKHDGILGELEASMEESS